MRFSGMVLWYMKCAVHYHWHSSWWQGKYYRCQDCSCIGTTMLLCCEPRSGLGFNSNWFFKTTTNNSDYSSDWQYLVKQSDNVVQERLVLVRPLSRRKITMLDFFISNMFVTDYGGKEVGSPRRYITQWCQLLS